MKSPVKTLAYCGVLAAMNIILSRLIAIPVGNSLRISVSSVPVILCGLWFGPFYGGLTGLTGDLAGCIFSGYAPNPLITLSAVLMGVMPGLLRAFMTKGLLRRTAGFHFSGSGYLRVLAGLALTMLLTSQGSTTLGLSIMYGIPFYAEFWMRIPQSALLLAINSLLVSMLYATPLTSLAVGPIVKKQAGT